MRAVVFICGLLLSVNLLGQEIHQGLRLFVYQVTKTGKQLMVNTKVDVTVNDTLKLALTTDDYGKINFVELPTGEYTIKIQHNDCETQEMRAVEIMENKIVYLSFNFICQSYLDSLSKKEKKQLGFQ